MSNDKLFFPAVFHKAEEGGFWITFPDLPECMTEGDNMSEAYEMASDALGLAITSRREEKEKIPKASDIEDIELSHGEFVAIVEFDLRAYQKKHNSRAVKKTLTIPEWLNEEAMAMNINFSQVLQDALILRIGDK